MGGDWYLIANPHMGTNEDPGVGLVLWSADESIARGVHLLRRLEPPSSGYTPPPAELVGTGDLTYRAIFEHESGEDVRPAVHTAHKLPEGWFINTQIVTASRKYYFTEPDPGDETQVVAISFSLPE